MKFKRKTDGLGQPYWEAGKFRIDRRWDWNYSQRKGGGVSTATYGLFIENKAIYWFRKLREAIADAEKRNQ